MANPPISNWGRWGGDDERGAANLLTPEKLLASLRLPAQGTIINLAQELRTRDVPMDLHIGRPVHFLTLDGGDYEDEAYDRRALFHGAGDYLGMHTHAQTTHIDALGHHWDDGQLYNGFDSKTVHSWGMRHCGIDKAGPFVTRGVLLDIAGLHRRQHLEVTHEVTVDDLQRAAGATAIEPGDAIVIRTGWINTYSKERPYDYWSVDVPGLGLAGAEWLAARDVVLVGSDNPGVEIVPPTGGDWFPVHKFLLRDCGIYLLEFLDLEELARAGAREFLFVAAPLRLRGGTASPLTPFAII